MKLCKTLVDETALLWGDDDVTLLACGDTATLEHLLQCRSFLRLLVDTARQPEHFGILGKAKTILDGFKEPVKPPVKVRGAPFDEALPAPPSFCPHCGRDNTGYPGCTSDDCPGNKGVT